MAELKRISLTVAKDMFDWITEESERKNLSKNAFVIIALENYFNQTKVMPHMQELMQAYQKMEESKRLNNED